MGKYLKVLILLFAFLSTTEYMYADNDTTYIVKVVEESEPCIYDDMIKHRMPPRPVLCTISPDGVSLAAIQSERISLFEVCNMDGECIASFYVESDFINYIYSSAGSVEIRLHLDESIYHGYLDL